MKYIYFTLISIFSYFYSINKYLEPTSFFLNFLLIILMLGSISYQKKINFNKNKLSLYIINSIILFIFIIPTFIYKTNIKNLTIKNISDEPIIIEEIYKDERLVKTNHKYNKKYDKINDASLKTEYKEYNKLDSSYKLTLYPNELYKVDTYKVKNIQINFQRKKNKNYKLLLNNKKITVNKYNFTNNSKANMIYDSSYKYKLNNTRIENNIFKIISFSILILLSSFFISIYAVESKKSIIKVLFTIIIEINPIIKITNFTKISLTIFLFLLLRSKLETTKINNKIKLLYLGGSLLISFTFIGDRLINDKINMTLVILFLVFALFIYLLFPYFINLIKYKKTSNNLNKNIIKHRIIIFLITIGICLLYTYIFNPFIVHTDTYMELYDLENGLLSNWHPYFHCVLINIFKCLFGNVKYFIYFRLIIYSLLLNNILFYFYKRGLKLKAIYLISIILTLSPVTAMMLITLVKDTDFSVCLTAVTFYFYLVIYDNESFSKNKINYLYLMFSLVLVAVLRHNGIYIFIIIILILIIFSHIRKCIYILGLSLLSILLVFFIKTTLYNYLEVSAAPKNFDIATMMHGINSLIVNNVKIDSKSYQYITTNIMSKNIIENSYDKYNIDLLLHYSDCDFRNKDINKLKLIKIYLKEFMKHPIYLIKDRLYGTDLIWNVSEKDRVRVYKYQTIYDEFDTNYAELIGIEQRFSPLSKNVNKILLYICDNEILNSIFFRAGIYLDLLIILVIYIIIYDKKKIYFILPIIINNLTLFIAMGHQEYRYVFMILLCSLLCLVITRYSNINIKKL